MFWSWSGNYRLWNEQPLYTPANFASVWHYGIFLVATRWTTWVTIQSTCKVQTPLFTCHVWRLESLSHLFKRRNCYHLSCKARKLSASFFHPTRNCCNSLSGEEDKAEIIGRNGKTSVKIIERKHAYSKVDGLKVADQMDKWQRINSNLLNIKCTACTFTVHSER